MVSLFKTLLVILIIVAGATLLFGGFFGLISFDDSSIFLKEEMGIVHFTLAVGSFVTGFFLLAIAFALALANAKG